MVGQVDEGRLVAGRYRLLERIGRGGMGTVWRAEDELLGRQVAVKKLHPPQPHMHEDELATVFERTRREARAAARISHPNVIVVHDVVDDAGLPSIVMEYVPSVTLGERLKQDGALPVAEVARIGRGMIAALRAAHRVGVLHRDVKPGNVLLGESDEDDEDDTAGGGSVARSGGYGAGRVVLTDFGIAQASGTSTLTRTGELIGSIDFLSPERIRGAMPGPEADLWALGATLYQAVQGESPFRRPTAIETAYAIAEEPVLPAANAGSLTRVIAGLLAKEPGERLSAEEAERMLRIPAADQETAFVDRTGFRSRRRTQQYPSRQYPAQQYPSEQYSSPQSPFQQYPSQQSPFQRSAAQDPAPHPSQQHFSQQPTQHGSFHPSSQQPSSAGREPPHAGATHQPAGPPAAHGRPHPQTQGQAPSYPHTQQRTGPYGHASAYTSAPAQPPRRGRTVGRWIAGAVAVAVLGAGAAVAATRMRSDDAAGTTGGTTGGPTVPVATTPATTPATTAPPTTTPPPPAVPDGYHLAEQASRGYSVPVPDGWTKTVKDGGDEVDWLDPTGVVGLKISALQFASTDPYQHFLTLEPATSSQVRGYHRERMERTTQSDEPAAIWQFTFKGDTHQVRAVDLGFGKPGGVEYAIYLNAPKAQWDTYRQVFENAVAGFRQTGP